MAEIGLIILDGTELRSGDLRLPIAGGTVNGKRVVEMAEAEAAARLFGTPLPDSLRSAVLRRLGSGSDNFLSIEFNEVELQKEKIQEYLHALAEELEDQLGDFVFRKTFVRKSMAQLEGDKELNQFIIASPYELKKAIRLKGELIHTAFEIFFIIMPLNNGGINEGI